MFPPEPQMSQDASRGVFNVSWFVFHDGLEHQLHFLAFGHQAIRPSLAEQMEDFFQVIREKWWLVQTIVSYWVFGNFSGANCWTSGGYLVSHVHILFISHFTGHDWTGFGWKRFLGVVHWFIMHVPMVGKKHVAVIRVWSTRRISDGSNVHVGSCLGAISLYCIILLNISSYTSSLVVMPLSSQKTCRRHVTQRWCMLWSFWSKINSQAICGLNKVTKVGRFKALNGEKYGRFGINCPMPLTC